LHLVTTHDPSGLASLVVGALALSVTFPLVAGPWGATGIMIWTAVAIAAIAAFVDARTGRIPDSLVLIAGMPTLAVFTAAAVDGHGGAALTDIVLGGLAFAGPLFVVHLTAPEALGFGDVKLAAALGAALGLVAPGLGMLALCFAAGAAVVMGLIGRRASVPFGPGLVLGTAVALMIGVLLGEAAPSWQ
jgi:leader peptidase (prepilin peptidase)/N-methyltransferase